MRATTEIDRRMRRFDSKGLAGLEGVRPLSDLFRRRGGFQCGEGISYRRMRNMHCIAVDEDMDGTTSEYGLLCTNLHYVLNKTAVVRAQRSQLAHV